MPGMLSRVAASDADPEVAVAAVATLEMLRQGGPRS